MESLGERITKLRIEKGISKADVARVCDITQTAYANIEKDITQSITIEIGKKIALAIGVSFNELFEIDLPKKDSELIEKLTAEKKMLCEKIEEKEKIIALLEGAIQNFKNAAMESFTPPNYYASQFLSIENLTDEQLTDINDLIQDFSNDLANHFMSRGCLSESDIKSFKSRNSVKKHYFSDRFYIVSPSGVITPRFPKH